MPPINSLRGPLIAVGLVAGAVAYNLSSIQPQLRFQYAPLNYWVASALALALPVSVLWLCVRVSSRATRLALGLAAAVTALPCAIFIFFSLLTAPTSGIDASFEKISQVQNGRLAFRLYRTNCGATCSFGLALRREIDLPLGLKLVTVLWGKDREDQAMVRRDSGMIQVVNQSNVFWSGPE